MLHIVEPHVLAETDLAMIEPRVEGTAGPDVRSGPPIDVLIPHPPSDGSGPAALDVSEAPTTAADMFDGFDQSLDEKLVTSDIQPLALEQYRKVAAILHHAQAARGIHVVMVASTLPREGKSLTSANLALTLSESFRRRVLLIDADLRRPTAHEIFGLPNVIGLTDTLKAHTDRPVPLIRISETLSVLPAGCPDPDPMSGLASDRMRRLIQDAAAKFDWVFIDTPPIGLLPDAKLLAEMVDVAILVIHAGSTPAAMIQRAADSVGRQRIIGVVLNRVSAAAVAGGYGYGYGYGYSYSQYYGTRKGKHADKKKRAKK